MCAMVQVIHLLANGIHSREWLLESVLLSIGASTDHLLICKLGVYVVRWFR